MNDDAQVLAADPNHPQHLAIQVFMTAFVQERRCTNPTLD
jgi:hypothetical protein